MRIPRTPEPKEEASTERRYNLRSSAIINEPPMEGQTNHQEGETGTTISSTDRVAVLLETLLMKVSILEQRDEERTRRAEERARSPIAQEEMPYEFMANPLLNRASPSSSPPSSGRTSISSSAITKELLKGIEQYDGDYRHPEKLFTFLRKLDDYHEASDCTNREIVLLASSRLKGNADTWYRLLLKEKRLPRLWADFKQKIMDDFIPKELGILIRNKLARLKQTGGVATYNQLFTELALQAPTMTEDEKCYTYLNGLKSTVAAAISTNSANTQSLEALQLAAIRQDQISSIGETRHQSRPKSPSKGNWKGKLTAMANLAEKSKNQSNRRRRTSPQRKRFPCAFCDQIGHPTYLCPELQSFKQSRVQKENSTEEEVADIIEHEILLTVNKKDSPDELVLDGGATTTFIKDSHLLANVIPLRGSVTVGDGTKVPITGKGTITLSNGKSRLKIAALFVPGLHRNLLSENQLRRNGFCVTKNATKVAGKAGFIMKNGTSTRFSLYDKNGLTFVDTDVATTASALTASAN